MKTLLQINVSTNLWSTGKIAEQIGITAQNDGWNCWVAHGARSINTSQLNNYQVSTLAEVRWHAAYYSRILDRQGLGCVSATKKFIDFVKTSIKPDIVHLHNIHGYYINYKILFEYLQEAGVPVVWTLHDCWPFTGHCGHFDKIGCMLWKSGCCNCPQKGEYPKSILLDNSRNNYKLKKNLFTSLGDKLTLVPVSEWLADFTEQSFFSGTKVQVIHNGIDINTFNIQSAEIRNNIKNKYNISDKKVLLGVASPWTERKGYNDFFKLRSGLGDEYAIIMVGLSPKQLSSLPKGIIGIERTQNATELAGLYSCADVFVNTTYEDNYPTVNLEAIACGTPVITYNTGGSPEAVTQETGMVVPQGDIDCLVSAIRNILGDDRETYRRACRMRAEKCFDKTKCFEQYITLYNELIDKYA